MTITRTIIGFGLVIFFLLSCEKKVDDLKPDFSNQKVLFQVDYINFAWGYQHSGFLIDSSGHVYCYQLPKDWNNCDSNRFLTVSEMDSNLNWTDSICYTINKHELDLKKQLIIEASKGTISEPIHEMYDFGGIEYSGYLLNKKTQKYESILLKQTGDFQIDNSSHAAIDLYNWLLTINKSVLKK
jgi:hypothetical protein